MTLIKKLQVIYRNDAANLNEDLKTRHCATKSLFFDLCNNSKKNVKNVLVYMYVALVVSEDNLASISLPRCEKYKLGVCFL